MKINEKFCCSVDFPRKTSIKVDSEVNLAWILQMPFFLIVFLFAKSFLKYHLAFLISLFYFYKGAIKLKLPNSPKTRRRSVSFGCSFLELQFSHPSCLGNHSYIHAWRAWSDQHCGWRVHLFNFSLTLDYQNFFDCLFSRLSKDFLKAFFTAKYIYKFIQIDKFNSILFTDFGVWPPSEQRAFR